MKVLVVVLVVDRIGGELPAALLKLTGGNGAYDTAVKTARKHCTKRNIADKLALYGIGEEVGYVLLGLLYGFLMGKGVERPVGALSEAASAVHGTLGRAKLPYPFEDAASRLSGRA